MVDRRDLLSRPFVVVFTLALLASTAHAAPAAPAGDDKAPQAMPTGLMYDFVLGLRVNPLGLIGDFRLRYRTRLYESASKVLEQNFVGPVVGLVASPQFVRPAVGVELQPLSILHLYGGYEPIGWLGTLGSLRSFPNAGSDFGSGIFQTAPPSSPGDTYASFMHQVVLSATVRLKVRSIGFRNLLRAAWLRADLRGGDTVFYDALFDVALPARGWFLFNETDLAWLSGWGLTVGIRHALTHVFYPPEAQALAPSDPNPVTPMSRLGPFVAWTFFERPHARVDSPTLLLMANWNLAHRYRTGQVVDQAFPTIVLGLSIRGSLLEK